MNPDIMATPLEEITINAIERLQRHSRFKEPYVSYESKRSKLHIGITPSGENLNLGPYDRAILSSFFKEKTITKTVFHDLAPISDYLMDVCGGMPRLFYNRCVTEVAKKIPIWSMKNKIYKHLGVGIQDLRTTIIAPNVWIDYIYPQLITSIGPNTFIGEDAYLATHAAFTDRFEIAELTIGANCTIGGAAMVGGCRIGDGAEIVPGALVTYDVPAGQKYVGLKLK